MKRFFVCAFMALSLFAMSAMASAAPIFTENFDTEEGSFISANWAHLSGGPDAGYSYAAVVDKLLVVAFSDTGDQKVFSTNSWNLQAGTYTFAVNVASWTYSAELGLGAYADGKVVEEVRKVFSEDNGLLELTFELTSDASIQLAFLGKTDWTEFHISSATFDGSPAATPIPAAVFLLAPGVAGLAALRKRMN